MDEKVAKRLSQIANIMSDFTMHIPSILITGANRGIGFELVKQLVAVKSPPNYIFACCRNPEGAENLKELAKTHSNVKIVKIDIGDESSYQSAVQQVSQDVGETGLNVLFNVAGILTSDSFHKVTAETMRNDYEVDCIGPLMVTKAFYPLLKKAAGTSKVKGLSCSRAAVLNMNSGMGSIINNASGGCYPYRGARAALNMITRSMSIDFKSDGIMAVSIEPGWVATDMGGKRASITPTQCVHAMFDIMAKIGEEENGKVMSWRGHVTEY